MSEEASGLTGVRGAPWCVGGKTCRALNFGSVVCGSTASRVIYMQNHSDVPVLYDFQVRARAWRA